MRELVPLTSSSWRARRKTYDLNFTVDAEEADRLELSLDVIAAVLADPSLAGWNGFGLAIQAYQKRARFGDRCHGRLAERLNRRLMVRLVKGAYWDTEVKRAQERGLDDYPVFTRKAMTDLQLRGLRRKAAGAASAHLPAIRDPQRADRRLASSSGRAASRATSSSACTAWAKRSTARCSRTIRARACRAYAPVGGHRDLLAYLVRRLLENGANSSFVSVAADPDVPVADASEAPGRHHRVTPQAARHPKLPLPRDLYGPERPNSRGVEFGHRAASTRLLAEIGTALAALTAPKAGPRSIDGKRGAGPDARRRQPDRRQTVVGQVTEASPEAADRAMAAARAGFPPGTARRPSAAPPRWSAPPTCWRSGAARSSICCRSRRGKTLDDALSEVREAVDFCRYYAAQAPRAVRRRRGACRARPARPMCCACAGAACSSRSRPGTSRSRSSSGRSRAALMAGNAVVAKPAEQTPLIAAEAVRILHEAGVPTSALHLVPGDGRVGARLVEHKDVAGVVFTGSTEVARLINRTLAAKDAAIVPLIAETGGINAMIVDATALPEQVADDVVTSAFRSAGQRCSALRLLCVQEDVADRMIEMIVGRGPRTEARRPARALDPCRPGDRPRGEGQLDAHIARMKRQAKVHYAGEAPTRRHLCRAACLRAEEAARSRAGSVRPDPARGPLPGRPPRATCSRPSRAPATA